MGTAILLFVVGKHLILQYKSIIWQNITQSSLNFYSVLKWKQINMSTQVEQIIMKLAIKVQRTAAKRITTKLDNMINIVQLYPSLGPNKISKMIFPLHWMFNGTVFWVQSKLLHALSVFSSQCIYKLFCKNGTMCIWYTKDRIIDPGTSILVDLISLT